MKKIIIGLIILGFCSTAWAIPDWVSAIQKQTSGLVKSGSGVVYSVVVGYKGVTTGDYIQIINGLTSGGTVDSSIYASSGDGVSIIHFNPGLSVDTGIYYNEAQKTGGTFSTTIQYQ